MKSRETAVSQADVISEYNEMYSSPDQLHDSEALYRWVLDLFRPQPGERLLDVACGIGLLVRLAQQRGLCGIGVDLAIQALRRAQERLDGEVNAVANGESLPFANDSFDYVANLGSLEHFADPVQGVREMRRVLHPGGRAAILLPNSYYLADIIWHVWRTGYSVSHSQPIERFATYGEWKDLLEEGGLRVERGYKYNFRFPRTRNDWRWYFRHRRKFFYLAVSPFVPFNLSYSFLYLCRPA